MPSVVQNSWRIWDASDSLDDHQSNTILWSSFLNDGRQLSIPRYLEEHSARLREKYLKFIFDLSQSKVNGITIVQHFGLQDGFSFWWLNKIAEKSPFKSPKICDCLKLLALEEILKESAVKNLTLTSANKDLAISIQYLCQGLNINFDWKKTSVKKQFTLRAVYEMLPYVLQAIVSLRHLFSRWQLRNQYIPKWFGGPSSILMCSYFFNLNAKGDGNCFHSNQWGRLSSHLKDLGYKLNWIHHYLPSPDIPNVHVATSKLGTYNRGAHHEIHSFLDGYLSLSLILRVIRKWWGNNIILWRKLDVSRNFQVENSYVWLWPMLKHDWKSSILGVDSIMNWFWVELFDRALKDLPKQGLGIYLWENQAWEAALLKAWKKYHHGQIIGVPHATTCFWHLNNFEDCRCLVQFGNFSKPLPDYLAVNGKMAWRQFIEAGYPPLKMREVEAMRFEYLAKQTENSPTKNDVLTLSSDSVKRILLLGDFTLSRTIKMLDCIRGLNRFSGHKIHLTIKPHPVSCIGQSEYPHIHFEVTNEPIQSLVGQFDMVLASNTTSAALDALLSGLPVAVYIDGADFNHSPLKNISNTSFITTSQQLNSFLYTASAQNKTPSPDDFFWFHENLERWTTLISEAKNQ